jgi:succinate dehydrogenase iron-sulfur subunit
VTVSEAKLRIQRFNPELDDAPHWESYTAPWEPRDRVLDALHYVKWYVDGSLTFRRSCAHGVCGSDAMQINGLNKLACKTLIKDLRQPIRVGPLKAFAVKKDLVVDMDPFFASYRAMLPYLIEESTPSGERIQSPEERARFDDTTKCILCAACTTACPVVREGEGYVGPAAIVAAHRFIFDSRDHGREQRLEILGREDGAFKCRTTFACTDACPRGIHVTEAINEVKREILEPTS